MYVDDTFVSISGTGAFAINILEKLELIRIRTGVEDYKKSLNVISVL